MLRIIADRRRRERQELARQKEMTFEDSDENEEERMPPRKSQEENLRIIEAFESGEQRVTYAQLTEAYENLPLFVLIERGEVKTCRSCSKISFVDRNKTAHAVYHHACQIEGCDSYERGLRKADEEPMKRYREEEHWPAKGNDGLRGARKSDEPCVKFIIGTGCTEGNLCPRAHEYFEETNRCYTCGAKGHISRNCSMPQGDYFRNKVREESGRYRYRIEVSQNPQRSKWPEIPEAKAKVTSPPRPQTPQQEIPTTPKSQTSQQEREE